MTVQKILGTAACMVIIGVSAGVSYGQFQRLTAKVAPTPVAAQASSSETLAPSADNSGSAEFVSASLTTWKAAEPSGVTAPHLSSPIASFLPEPPLQSFAALTPAPATRTTPVLNEEAAAFPDPIVSGDVPTLTASTAPVAAAIAVAPVVRKVAAPGTRKAPAALKTASRTPATPGTIRRFRNSQELDFDRGQNTNTSQKDSDGSFERPFPPRVAAAPRKPRAAVSASARAVQRQARFQRVWATGVYR